MTDLGRMLKVVMDGIKDANELIDCGEEADSAQVQDWLYSKAKKRYTCLTEDYEYIANMIGLKNKINSGDEMAEAFNDHISYQIAEIKRRLV